MVGLDVLIYNAGADPHVDDPLGGVLTTEQLRLRDEIVLMAAAKAGVPVALSLAGGYQSPIEKVLEIHDNTFAAAIKAEVVVSKQASKSISMPSRPWRKLRRENKENLQLIEHQAVVNL